MQVVAWAAKEKQEFEGKLSKLEHMAATREESEATLQAEEEDQASRRRAEEAGKKEEKMLQIRTIRTCLLLL